LSIENAFHERVQSLVQTDALRGADEIFDSRVLLRDHFAPSSGFFPGSLLEPLLERRLIFPRQTIFPREFSCQAIDHFTLFPYPETVEQGCEIPEERLACSENVIGSDRPALANIFGNGPSTIRKCPARMRLAGVFPRSRTDDLARHGRTR